MHTALSYHVPTGKLQKLTDLTRLGDCVASPDEILWLDLLNPDPAELDALGQAFHFHHLALEDVKHGHQRPKLDEYEGYFFIVLYTMSYIHPPERDKSGLQTSEINLFIGKNYLITIHHDDVPEIESALQNWQANPDMLKENDVSFLLYIVCDNIVDRYFPLMDAVEDVFDSLEEEIFVAFNRQVLTDIFSLRKDLLTLRKIVGWERDVFNVLIRRDVAVLDPKSTVFFSDIYDHVLRITDTVDTYRDLLSGALDGYLSVTSNNLSEIMKVLTSASIILMTITLVPSIYGMNFKNIPELAWDFGYPYALGLMVVISIVLAIYFHRRGWL